MRVHLAFQELFFTLPIEKDGKRIEHEEVVRQLDSDTLSQSNTVGTDGNTFSAGNFAQLIKFRLKVEKRKYALVVQWFRDLLWYRGGG